MKLNRQWKAVLRVAARPSWLWGLLGLLGLGLLFWLGLVLALTLSPALPLLDGLSFSPLVLDRQGQLLRMGLTADEKYRARVTLPEITPQAIQATLLYEDRYFYRHPGVNPLALARAVLGMARGERRMGGSTITMQVVRLRYGLETTTVHGKLRQMWLALCLERQYSKRQILEAYFCLAPYGGNVEGIGAAARIYFGRTPAQLTLDECLALAPVPQNPVRRWPLAALSTALPEAGFVPKGGEFAAARARMQTVWAQAHPSHPQERFLRGEGNTPAPLRILGPSALPFEAPHVSAALLTEAARQAHDPVTARNTTFRTTLSLPLQKLLEQRLAAFAARGRVYGISNAAALLLHWPSMEIRAQVGSANFADARIAGQVDGTLARRSPGSTLKPFIYALALDQGLIHPQTLLVDSPRSFGGYNPENFDRTYRGPLPAHEALRASRNIPAIWLASRLDPDLYTLLHRAGVPLPFSLEHYGLSLVLGGAELSMRHLAELYAMLPNKGIWRPARLLDRSSTGASTENSEVKALLSPEAAVLTLYMLEEAGRELRTRRGVIPHRYKTGTSNRFRDAWTVGIVGPYVLAVWVGNFDNSPNPLLVGGDVAAPLYEDIAEGLALREPLTDMAPLPTQALGHGLNLVRIPVCTDTGDLDVSLCQKTTETWYIPGVSPTRSSNVYRTILVDSRTGLRACQPSPTTREEVREFWPTDLQGLFARAGLVKPVPPPYGPECAGMEGDTGGMAQSVRQSMRPDTEQAMGPNAGQGAEQLRTGVDGTGSAPRILSPRDGVIYQRRVGDEISGRNAIPLVAGVDADAKAVFWFVNDRFVGRRDMPQGTTATDRTGTTDVLDQVLLWQPEGGTHVLRVVDNLGRASTRRVRVETLP